MTPTLTIYTWTTPNEDFEVDFSFAFTYTAGAKSTRDDPGWPAEIEMYDFTCVAVRDTSDTVEPFAEKTRGKGLTAEEAMYFEKLFEAERHNPDGRLCERLKEHCAEALEAERPCR